ncbi:hypothetical protein [Paeniglutamicibacter sp.]|uniref:hypothetical protein n=1 Tax=Paeniglutamicibacter sp. TaxID=1934391 RepID=UPI00398A24BB
MTHFLGLVPAKSELCWVLLEADDSQGLQVKASKKVMIPSFGNRERELAWVYTYVQETFENFEVTSICVVQGSLSQNGTESVLFRAQVEGVVLASLASLKFEVTSAKKRVIATRLGVKKGADISMIPLLMELREHHSMPKYLDEAMAAALMANV